MGAVSIALGVLSVFALSFTVATDRDRHKTPDAVGVAFAMLIVWAVSMLANAILPEPQSRLLNPVMDAMLAVGVFAATATRFAWWKLLFLGLLAIQVLSHVIYQNEYRLAGVLPRYILTLNVAYLAQLACVCTPGVGYVARLVGDHLRGHSSWHPVARP